MTDIKAITLAGLSDGAAEELFKKALEEVARNMRDPNTDWKGRREITLKLVFSQEEDRQLGEVEVKCSTKLAGVKGVKRPLYLGMHMGVPTMVEGPHQDDLFQNPKGGPRSLEPAAGGSA